MNPSGCGPAVRAHDILTTDRRNLQFPAIIADCSGVATAPHRGFFCAGPGDEGMLNNLFISKRCKSYLSGLGFAHFACLNDICMATIPIMFAPLIVPGNLIV